MKFDLNNPRTLANTGIMMAVTTALTLIQVPVPAGAGYVHLGDIAVFFTAFAFGPWVALVAGGVGTALADVISGYGYFAPLTLVVHGLQGFAAGWIANPALVPSGGLFGPRNLIRIVLGVLVGAAVVIGGYFLGEYFVGIWGTPEKAGVEAPFNVVQEAAGALGAVVYLGVARAFPRLVQRG